MVVSRSSSVTPRSLPSAARRPSLPPPPAGSLGCYLQLCRALLLEPPFSEPDRDSEVLARCHRHAVAGLHQQLVGERYQRWQAGHHPIVFPACFDPHHAHNMVVRAGDGC